MYLSLRTNISSLKNLNNATAQPSVFLPRQTVLLMNEKCTVLLVIEMERQTVQPVSRVAALLTGSVDNALSPQCPY